MKRREHRICVTVVALLSPCAAAALASCGSSGDAAAVSSAAGAGGAATTVTSGVPASSSSLPVVTIGSTSSSSTGAGGGGVAPTWETLTATPIGCSVDHLTNPGVARVFTWIPCDDGTPSCEEMQFDGPADTITTGLMSASHVQEEDGAGVRLELGIDYGGETTVYFAYEDGTLFDAYRTVFTADCALWQGSLAGSHLGILVGNLNLASPKLGGFTRDLSTGAPPAAFEVTPAPPGFGPQDTPMSPTRWAWQYGGGKVVSVSSLDGSGLVLLAEASNPAYPGLLDAHMVSGAGSIFLIPETFELDGGAVDVRIVSTDGLAQPTDYLRATDGSFYDFPVFADSHVAWFRGVGVISLNQYQRVELWASPFSADPAALAPFKVADYTFDAATFMAGGWGRVAMPSYADPPIYGQQAVYDLVHQTSVNFQLPDGRSLWTSAEMGLTKTHLYSMTQLTVENLKVVRFALPP